eukprot:gene7995-biopygen1551
MPKSEGPMDFIFTYGETSSAKASVPSKLPKILAWSPPEAGIKNQSCTATAWQVKGQFSSTAAAPMWGGDTVWSQTSTQLYKRTVLHVAIDDYDTESLLIQYTLYALMQRSQGSGVMQACGRHLKTYNNS